MAAKIIRLHPRSVEPKRLRQRDLRRFERLWAVATREMIKRLPCPVAFVDIIRCFDAAIDEIRFGRDICIAAGAGRPQKA